MEEICPNYLLTISLKVAKLGMKLTNGKFYPIKKS